MEELHGLTDKLSQDMLHLAMLMDCDELTPEGVMLALQVSKRVRRNSTLLLRLLAELRDNQL